MTTYDLGGILLTGGSSSRMGTDKATIDFGGTSISQRTADLLRAFADLAIEVGPGVTTLDAIQEAPPGEGPLGAIVAGHRALLASGLANSGSCIVLACDLPLLTAGVLRILGTQPSDQAVLPIIDGVAQPLCARWSSWDLARASEILEIGGRSLRGLPDPSRAIVYDETFFGPLRIELEDADTPEDLVRLRSARGM